MKEAQDKDVREGKEWGAIEENRGKGERGRRVGYSGMLQSEVIERLNE